MDIIEVIKNKKFEVNKFENFIKARDKSKHLCFLTDYTKESLVIHEITTYKVEGFDAGFGISSEGDIVNIFNNTEYKGIGELLLRAAIEKGGCLVDFFATDKLKGFFESCGFEKYSESPWDNALAPNNWDYSKYGTPSVIYSRLKV